MALCKGGKLRSVGNMAGQRIGYMFWCPGCDGAHVVQTENEPMCWGFNGDVERPTFTPSLLLRSDEHVPPVTPENIDEYNRAPWPQTKVPRVCHTFITDGRIQFLGDCTHALAGQTVEIPQWPESKMNFEDGHS